MLALILFIVVGLIFGYFATLNTALVSIHLSQTSSIENIPMYLLVLSSLGVGIVFSALFYFLKSIPRWFASGQKQKELTDAKKEIAELTRHVNQLELENSKLKSKDDEEETDEESL